jgi:rod shape-determining protein MreC
VYDRATIRRRRAALAAFVALSIAILTAYLGESGDGVFHGFQRTAQEAFAPVGIGAGRALKPVRDVVGWTGDTIDAKDESETLEAEVEQLRTELAEAQTAARDSGQLKALAALRRKDDFPEATQPVTARVIGRSPTLWHSSVTIDKGTSDGVRVDQPVIAAGGLAGKVTTATSGTAEVRLITDGESGVSAQVLPNGATGVVRPVVGDPENMLLDSVDRRRRVTKHTLVITSGFTSSKLESLFPRGIPIGRISKVDPDELASHRRVHVKPFFDLHRLDIVQVLTRRGLAPEAAAGAAG